MLPLALMVLLCFVWVRHHSICGKNAPHIAQSGFLDPLYCVLVLASPTRKRQVMCQFTKCRQAIRGSCAQKLPKMPHDFQNSTNCQRQIVLKLCTTANQHNERSQSTGFEVVQSNMNEERIVFGVGIQGTPCTVTSPEWRSWYVLDWTCSQRELMNERVWGQQPRFGGSIKIHGQGSYACPVIKDENRLFVLQVETLSEQ